MATTTRSSQPSSRRALVRGAGTVALSLAATPISRLSPAAAQSNPLLEEWTHLVGGGGSLLMYNKATGRGVSGTLDDRGFLPVAEYSDFAKGYDLVVGTARGSVLMLRNRRREERRGIGAAGTLINGQWTYLQLYRDFAPWTHAVASADSVFLYNRRERRGASGTLIDGSWTMRQQYRKWPIFDRFAASADTMICYRQRSQQRARAGTLRDGVWTYVSRYDDLGSPGVPVPNQWEHAVGTETSLLLQTNAAVSGYLVAGQWQQRNVHPNIGRWDLIAHAGDGYVQFYRNLSVQRDLAWGRVHDGQLVLYDL